MVKAEHGHADDGAQDEIDAGKQEQGGVLLHGHHIKEAIDQFRQIHAINGAQIDPRNSVGEVGGHAHKQAPLDHFHGVVLQTTKDGGQG